MSKPNTDHVTACYALLTYLYNTSSLRTAQDAFPDCEDDGYLAEKGDLCHRSPMTFLGSLDPWRLRRVIEVAMDRYGDLAASFAEQALATELPWTE